ncbi:Protein of unknown function [Bacillus cytotoxicus]|nr:Protein of unknown function [Bacillus cytotoxicus]
MMTDDELDTIEKEWNEILERNKKRREEKRNKLNLNHK